MERVPEKKPISKELKELFEADQADRIAIRRRWDDRELTEKMMENDSLRLKRAREIYDDYIVSKVSLSNQELVQLAFLFQHSSESDDYRKAQELAGAAGDEGKWMAAAAEDRWLLSQGKEQKWGTQFVSETEQAPMLPDEESGITDDMRAERDIPPRAEQLAVHRSISEREV